MSITYTDVFCGATSRRYGFEALDVSSRSAQPCRIIIEKPERQVASTAENSSNYASLMAVIDGRPTNAPGSRDCFRGTANCAGRLVKPQLIASTVLSSVMSSPPKFRLAVPARIPKSGGPNAPVPILIVEGHIASSAIHSSFSRHDLILLAERFKSGFITVSANVANWLGRAVAKVVA